jgi:hypothetical protein
MNTILVGTSITILGLIFAAIMWFSPESRLLRWAKQASHWDYATANSRLQEARRVVVSQFRHPNGEVSQSLADAAFDLAVACTDRINELNGKPHGPEHQDRLRRALFKTLQKEADYWVVGGYGIESLGRDQEPALYAARHKTAQIVR